MRSINVTSNGIIYTRGKLSNFSQLPVTITIFLSLLFLVPLALYALRVWDYRADSVEIQRLLGKRVANPPLFAGEMVEHLPEPAQRYFLFAIKEGTPLHRVAEISMHGQFGTGDKENPNYMPMTAKQVLALPEGFVWKMSGGSDPFRISGSDGTNWTRFWLASIIPVVRSGRTNDHTLSALGRYAAEAVFWTPAAVLPGPRKNWEAVDENTARLTINCKNNQQSVDVTVDEHGRPVRVSLERWSNANKKGIYQFQPFGGVLSEFREFEGFRLPTHIEAGNLIGTDDYFPFFIADVTAIRFLQ